MRRIIKGAEPKTLAEHRSQPGSNYDDYNDKQTLRECLVGEQRGLCCYCLSRIRAEISSMKIEHWHCQSRYPLEQLTYSNLLGTCKGNEGPYKSQCCDTRKADRDLKWNPANPLHPIEQVTFFANGMIGSSDP